MEYEKTKAAIEENVSLPSGSARKGKVARRKEKGVSRWRRSRRIGEKGYRREMEVEKRERDTSRCTETRREEVEPAERLGRFIPDQLHFQPSSEYKRQFNYREIFKGGSQSPLSSLPRLFLSLPLHLHPLSLYLSTKYPLEA